MVLTKAPGSIPGPASTCGSRPHVNYEENITGLLHLCQTDVIFAPDLRNFPVTNAVTDLDFSLNLRRLRLFRSIVLRSSFQILFESVSFPYIRCHSDFVSFYPFFRQISLDFPVRPQFLKSF